VGVLSLLSLPDVQVRYPISVAARECLLLADDLTGACDAAVHFALRGYRTAVWVSLDSGTADAPVLAISTDSRHVDPRAIPALISRAAALFKDSARILFKKMDSTLRGNTGIEIRATLEAFGCDAAVITPAFPGMDRIVEAGRLRLTGDPCFEPIDVSGWLRSQGLEGCVAVRGEVAEAISAGARFVSADAVCDADLDRIAVEVLTLERRILWAGSAGLAAAIARALPLGKDSRLVGPPHQGPVLFCVGSDHKTTVAQQEALVAGRLLTRVSAERATAECITAALRRGEHVLLQIPRDRISSPQLRELIIQAPASALLLSGGDTASHVCRAIGARTIHLIDEIVTGLPRGILSGGGLDGIAVATKSGGFGHPDALIQVADFFACPNH
jgi:D-threonate/D-erythronate kinase